MDEQKRTAIVTGGNRGIGFEVCRQLGLLGYRVVLTSRKVNQGLEAVEQLKREGGEIVFRPLDVTSQRQIKDLKHYVERYFGGADVLVNNAAVYPDEGRGVLEVESAVYHSTMDTNLFGPLMLCQEIVPGMMERGYGRVVNVSSGAGQISSMVGDTPSYRLSKLALNGLTLMLADATRGSNVLSTQSVRAGFGRRWVARPPPAASSKAPTASSGWRRWRMGGRVVGSIGIASSFPW